MIGLMSHVVPRTFPVIDISAWDAGEIEEMGARDKLWVTSDPDVGLPSHLWKAARSHGKLPDYGADSCAERMAAELACLLGVLAVPAKLAVRQSQRGVITERIKGELRHGNELLSALMPDYEKDRRGPVAGYDLESIRSVLAEYSGWSEGVNAFDCFTGLLVFDALIGNTDRHHENWAVVQDTGILAPSFDHGASLGFNATAAQMADPSRYAARARARHFGRDRSPSDVAQEALTRVGPDVSDMWLRRVESIEDTQIQQIVEAIPGSWMSVPRRTFVTALVGANRRRLLA